MANGKKMDLSQIVDASIERTDVGSDNVLVKITLNLTGSLTFSRDYYLNEDAAILKSGTNLQKAALRKKYIRRCVEAYLSETKPMPVITPQGSTTVQKTAFQEEGDTL